MFDATHSIQAISQSNILSPDVEKFEDEVKSSKKFSQPSLEMNPAPRPSILRARKQLYCRKALNWYWRRRSECEPGLIAQLNSLYDTTKGFNEVEVCYGLKGWAGEIGYGRVYANLNGSLETLPKTVRYNLCEPYYWDIDMKNAQPSILSQLADKYGVNLKNLKNYCSNREAIIKEMVESGQYGSPSEASTRDKVKTNFIACFYGAKIPGFEPYQNDLKRLYQVLKDKPEWEELHTKVQENAKAYNIGGCFLAILAQTIERKILERIDEFLESKGRIVDSLAYDGCMIRKEKDEAILDSELLREAELYISEKESYNMELLVKPMKRSIPQEELDSITVLNPVDELWKLVEENTPSSITRLYALLKSGEVLYSKSLNIYYIYNKKVGLWIHNTPADINNDFVDTINCYIQDTVKAFPQPITDEIRNANVEKRKRLDKLMAYVSSKAKNLVNDFLPTHVITESDPALMMNQTRGLFPCSNGVFDMINNRLITYKKEHYFTFKLKTAYNPDADTSVIEDAMNKWYRSQKEVISFMRYWIGYMLTPEVNRQEFLVAWGENAGNGKSTLFDDLLRIILTANDKDKMKTYWHKFDTKALSKTQGGNNDTLFYSMGKRACVLSEPGKPDSNLIKIITGESTVSCEAKYKGNTTFNITAKTAVLCNKMFEVEFADEGILRRILVVEMNTKFLDKDDYDRADSKAKEEGRIQLRDKDFIGKLKDNLEGVLLYFLKGAVEYYADPNKKVPDVFFNSKMKAKSEADDITQWLMGHLIQSKDDSIKLKDLKLGWKAEGHNFNCYSINKQGFNKEFIKRCESAGFKVKYNENRPEDAVILNVKLWNDDDEEKMD